MGEPANLAACPLCAGWKDNYMFNLIVTGLPFEGLRGWCVLGRDRIFGHTHTDIAAQFKRNGSLDHDAVKRLPTIFTNETRFDPANATLARIGTITSIREGTDCQIEYRLDPDIAPIPNAVLETLSAELDLKLNARPFPEFQTNHWAIKDADLFQVLFKHGIGHQAKPKVFELMQEPIDSNLAAVMMPFDKKFDPVYVALQTAITRSGMTPRRADDFWHHDHLIQDIVSLIGKAAVVICDLTDRNSNVFYELGIAHTLGRNVIMVTQSHEHVPFDVRHIRHIPYLNNAEGLGKLANEVAERLLTLKGLHSR
jgi:hypothetical protein